jgi:holliday junction resolvase YEN1
MDWESNNLILTWAKEPDLDKLAGLCEFYFEWGYTGKESIIMRFRTVLCQWHSTTLRILRRTALTLDVHAKPSTPTRPTTPRKREIIRPSETPSKLIARHFSFLKSWYSHPPANDTPKM